MDNGDVNSDDDHPSRNPAMCNFYDDSNHFRDDDQAVQVDNPSDTNTKASRFYHSDPTYL